MFHQRLAAIGLAALLSACGGGGAEPQVRASAAARAMQAAAGPSMASVLGAGGGAAEQAAISRGAAVASQTMPGASTPPLASSIGSVVAAAAEAPRAKVLAVTTSSAGSSTDLIWHNPTTGQTVSWAMNGAATTSSTTLLQAPNWKVTRTADLNGDGQQDLIWENSSTNQIVAWLMNGSQTLQSTVLLQSAGWKITHAADFNGDGKADLLFYNAGTGQTVLWLMNGTGVLSSQILFTSSVWQVSLLADLNGDGKADLIWRNSQTGQTAAWLMNGTTVSANATLLELANWRITQVGDLDGDGRDDLIWTNTATGQTVVWLMNGLATGSSTLLFTHATWRVSRVADLDGDGKQDLIWTNSATSEVAGWLMNGAAIKSNAVLLGNASWQLANVVDLNGDGKQDLIWRNAGTNQTVAWVMNGLAASSQTTLLAIPGWEVVALRANTAGVPVANAGAAQAVTGGAVVTLDGTASTASVGKQLTYAWTLTAKPAGSNATLSNAAAAKPTFVADLAGQYVASLVVSDGSRSSSATVVVSASAASQPGALPPTTAKSASISVLANGSNLAFASLTAEGYGLVIYQGKEVYGLPAGQAGTTSPSSFVTSIGFTDPSGGVYQLMLDQTALPTRLYAGGYVIQRLAVNLAADTIDLRVIKPDGSYKDYLGVSLDTESSANSAAAHASLGTLAVRQSTVQANVRPLGAQTTPVRCKEPSGPAPAEDDFDGWGDRIEETATCIPPEVMDGPVGRGLEFLFDKSEGTDDSTLTKVIGTAKTVWRVVMDGVRKVDRILGISGGGSETVDVTYTEGHRGVKKPIVVAEPAPSHVRAVISDLGKLKGQPNPTDLVVVPKDSIVAPKPNYLSPPVPAPVSNPGPACRNYTECVDYGSALSASAREFWSQLRCPLPFTETASIYTEKDIPSLRKSALQLRPTDVAIMTQTLLAEIISTGPKVTVVCQQSQSNGGRRIMNSFVNSGTFPAALGLVAVEQVLRFNAVGEFDGEQTESRRVSIGGAVLYAFTTYKSGVLDGAYAQSRRTDFAPFEAGQYKDGKLVGDIAIYWGPGYEQKIVKKYSQTGELLSQQQFSKSGNLCLGSMWLALVDDNPNSPTYGRCIFGP